MHVNLTSAQFNETILRNIEPFIYEKVSSFRGSISAEHGIGLMKTKYLKYSKTEQEIIMMKNLKRLLDPNGILSPEKVISERWISILDLHFYIYIHTHVFIIITYLLS